MVAREVWVTLEDVFEIGIGRANAPLSLPTVFQLLNQFLPNLFRFRRERFNGLGDVQAETKGSDQE
jgi:hypothetical protein